MYQLFRSSRAEKCECINVFSHRELTSANVLFFRSLRTDKCESISCLADRVGNDGGGGVDHDGCDADGGGKQWRLRRRWR